MKKSRIGLVAIVMLGLSTAAHAVPIPITDTLADYSSPPATSGFPIDRGIVGTFSFDIGTALDAVVSGSWGNNAFSTSSAGADVYLDGILVAQCLVFASCWFDSTGTQFWSYTFTAADLATGVLDDGLANLRVIQTSSLFVRLGSLAISGTVDVPEPTTIAAFCIGLFGLGLMRRKVR